MQVERVDEADVEWEDDRPRFRVYLFEGPVHAPGAVVDTYDITEADVFEVVRWAQEQAGYITLTLWRLSATSGSARRRMGVRCLAGWCGLSVKT
jgi:hypothetical protein